MPSPTELLAIYLRHHTVAAKGGEEFFARAAEGATNPVIQETLTELAAEVADDRQSLLAILERLDIPQPAVGEQLASLGEKVGRLKPNGSLTQRTPLTQVVELEGAADAVQAKRLGWVTLREIAASEPRLDSAELDTLVQRADSQLERLEGLRQAAVLLAFTPQQG